MKKGYIFIGIGLLLVAVLFSCKKDNEETQPSDSTHSITSDSIIVSKDGSGDFSSVQEAINAVADNEEDTTVIYIKNGTYREVVTVPPTKSFLKLIGESVDGVILTYDNYAALTDPSTGKAFGTAESASFFVYSSDFTAKNITFENSHGRGSQALAIHIKGDRVKFINCRFLGFQDTIYTGGGKDSDNQSRIYFKDCYIKGATDFIFGVSIAVFDNCTIYCQKGGYYITAASTPEGAEYGYVFLHCNITGNAPENSVYLGRPWRKYANVVYIECNLGNMIKPEGWSKWNDDPGDPRYETVTYAEYKNNGPGAADESQRVSWAQQLTEAEAAKYTLKDIFGDWKF